MKDNKLLLFLQEIFIRLNIKSPKFFRVLKIISLCCCIITGVPEIIEYFNVVLPDSLQIIANKTVAIASLVMWFISSLTVEEKIIETENTIVKDSASRKIYLPFSEKFVFIG